MSTSSRLVGESAAARALRARLQRYARFEAPVLVLGETGVGKELSARMVHAQSERQRGPFVPVNCGAIPRDLVEAELFGSAAGAFTGARARDGLLRQAHRGTLFLDEVGELPPAAQSVLLRALETAEVWAVGADRPRAADFRLVSATNRDLADMVQRGQFRADLYHRLATLVVQVPPLRERRADVPAIARALVGDATDRLTPCAWRALEAHRWPGNVRELRNVLLRALADTDGPITAGALGLEPVSGRPASDWDGRSLFEQIAACVHAALRQHGGNVRATARALQVSPTTVYRYLHVGEPGAG